MPGLALAFGIGAAGVLLLPALPSPASLLPVALAALLAVRMRAGIAAMLCGFVWTAFGAAQWVAGDFPCARDREEVGLTGVIATPALPRAGRIDFELDVIEPDRSRLTARRLRLSWYEPTALPLPGQLWRMTARLRCRNGMSNPGAPDRELDLLRQRIGATGYLVSGSPPVLIEDRPARRPVQRLRARIAAALAARLPDSPSTAVLQGLSVGVRGSIPDNLWEAFAATGVAHLMAISGLHVTGCALSALLLLQAFWRLPWIAQTPARIGIEMTVVVAITAAYALLAGASLPTMRTLVMVAVLAWQRVLRRAVPLPATLALAAALLIGADPLALSSSGFWLSFVATAVLLAMIDAGPGLRGRVAGFLRAQAAILALLTPVLAAAFGRLSVIAPLANGIAIPVFSFGLLPVILFATALSMVSMDAAAGIWIAVAAILDAVWPWLEAVGRLPGATWAVPAQPVMLLLGAGIAGFGALLVPLRSLRIGAGVALLALVLGRGERPDDNAWTLTVLDVGQGLAAIVQTRAHVLVFDTGPRWRSGLTAAHVTLLPWLRAAGIRRIDRMLISHADMDHAGGATVLQDAFPIREIMAGPGVTQAGVASVCRRGDHWNWEGIEFRVLHPGPDAMQSDNDNSCALLVSGRGGTALLLADTEADAEASLLAESLAADVVLLPHHGSRTSSSPALVRAVGARVGIASAGLGNRWGLPDREVTARWRAAGTTVLTTADAGAVTVRFAGSADAIRVAAHRLDSRHWWQRSPTG
jgi:competence protein ComEC